MNLQSWTPGRVNLIGEWIDFNGGTVLPASLPLGVEITLDPSPDNFDHVTSAQFPGKASAERDAPAQKHWADYVFGALQTARKQGWIKGAQTVRLDSTIPAGAGVSSSAAVTVGVLKACVPNGVDPTRIALLAQSVENEFIGVPCGIMDQMAVAHARPGEALALDTRALKFEQLAIPEGWTFAVINSGIERKLADGRYKERRDACLAAAKYLGIDYLCDAKDLSALPSNLHPIGQHVLSEDARSRAAIAALRRSDALAFGHQMLASHASLRKDFKVSTPEIDALVDDAVQLGAWGARITGAGFGGCIVVLLVDIKPAQWWADLHAAHPASRWICDVKAG